MSDVRLAVFWSVMVMAGLTGAVVLRRRGVPAARVRDVLHGGAGVWVFGWPEWDRAAAPVAITWGAVAVLAVLPLLAARRLLVDRIVSAVTTEDERWSGLVLYALAFALLTTAGLATALPPGAAAGALLALAWGDGLGGAVGARFGRRTYRLPWAKRKSWLGSAVVAVATVLGLVAWAAWVGSESPTWAPWVGTGDGVGAPGSGSELPVLTLAGAGVVAALAEAAAPRGTDNLVVPGAVFAWFLAWG